MQELIFDNQKEAAIYWYSLNKLGYNIHLDFKGNNYVLTFNVDYDNEMDNNHNNSVKK